MINFTTATFKLLTKGFRDSQPGKHTKYEGAKKMIIKKVKPSAPYFLVFGTIKRRPTNASAPTAKISANKTEINLGTIAT